MFLVLSVLGILSFVPNFGNTGYTFVMDEAVDEANKYCAGEFHLGYGIPVGGLKTCPQACECNGKPCDFDELSTLWEAEAGFGFALLVLTILTYAVAFTGALQESPALLKPFVYIMPALMGLGLITGILAAVADTTIWKAWVMYDNPPYDWQCGWAFDFPPQVHVYFIFAWPALMLKFCKNLTGPCPAPTYLPTYLPYLWETKKEITGWVKVGYYTN